MRKAFKYSPFRFSLRFAFLCILFFCLWLGWTVNRARKQEQTVSWIRENQGEFYYDFQRQDPPPNSTGMQQWGGSIFNPNIVAPPNKLRDWLGDDYFLSVSGVSFIRLEASETAVSELGRLEELPKLTAFAIRGGHVNDAGLARVGRLTSLEELTISGVNVTNAGIKHLTDLGQLRILMIGDGNVTDEGMKSVASLRQLNALMLMDVEVSGKGLHHLQVLPDLEFLMVTGSKHDPPTVEDLKLLRHLREFHWWGQRSVQVNGNYAKKLQSGLPKCRVVVR